jgi:hypothetical protein
MQQSYFPHSEIKFQLHSPPTAKFQNGKHTCLSNLNSLLEGYLQQQGEKIFFSPWKQRVSPVACAQPDK